MPSTEHSTVGAFIAGGLAGIAGVVAGHPLDTTKVQQQIHKGEQGIQRTVNYIGEQGWVKGFFRGMSFPLVTSTVVNSLVFGVYNYSLRIVHNDPLSTIPSYWTVFIAGSLGGAAQLVVACPSEVVKVMLQSQIPESRVLPPVSHYTWHGPRQCVQHVFRRYGAVGFYRGFAAMSIRDIPGYGIYLVAFEFLDHTLQVRCYNVYERFLAHALSGGLAGSLSWAAILPFDVMKSRLQADEDRMYKGLWDCAVKSFREEGSRVFFRGFLMCTLRGFPSAVFSFLTYTQALRLFDRFWL